MLEWPWHQDAGFLMKPRKKGVAPLEVRHELLNVLIFGSKGSYFLGSYEDEF